MFLVIINRYVFITWHAFSILIYLDYRLLSIYMIWLILIDHVQEKGSQNFDELVINGGYFTIKAHVL